MERWLCTVVGWLAKIVAQLGLCCGLKEIVGASPMMAWQRLSAMGEGGLLRGIRVNVWVARVGWHCGWWSTRWWFNIGESKKNKSGSTMGMTKNDSKSLWFSIGKILSMIYWRILYDCTAIDLNCLERVSVQVDWLQGVKKVFRSLSIDQRPSVGIAISKWTF